MTPPRIHPTAIIAPDADIAADVEIGAFAIVGEGCTIDSGCVIAPRATLERNVTLGRSVKVGIGTVLGGAPQDLKYAGEETTVRNRRRHCHSRVRDYQSRHAHSFKRPWERTAS